MKTTPTFKAYIRAICRGPCLASTVHNCVMDDSTSMGDGAGDIWRKLTQQMGENAARNLVDKWIAKPWKL